MFFRLAVYVIPRIVKGSVVHCRPVSLQIVFELIFETIQIAFVLEMLGLGPENFENCSRELRALFKLFSYPSKK